LKPGQYSDGNEIVILKEPVDIDLVERFHYQWDVLKEGSLDWYPLRYLWSTATPVGQKSAPERTVTKLELPWYKRWFAPRIPQAKVVKE